MPTDCRVWRWSKYPDGYGRVKLKGKATSAHRVFYEMYKGPVPEGMVLDHLCGRKDCCEPEHLEAVSTAENSSREFKAKGWRRMNRCKSA